MLANVEIVENLLIIYHAGPLTDDVAYDLAPNPNAMVHSVGDDVAVHSLASYALAVVALNL